MNIAKSIKVAAAMREMTQAQVAEESGIGEVTISKLVNNKTSCKLSTLICLAKTFEMPVWKFIRLGEIELGEK